MYKTPYKRNTFLLIILSTVFRIFLASNLEFGNDEVYYWLYAKYPSISHFDHPPMVGFFIQLITVNLYFDTEEAIRLAAIVSTSISMYIVFLIGTFLKDDRTGFITTLLYNLSIYGFIISGTFILPDGPLVLFWLLSFYLLINILPKHPLEIELQRILLVSFFIGCAIYSKYQGIYLLLGSIGYILFFNRKWFKNWRFYMLFIFPVIAMGLIFYWNYQNDFISYKFHGNRVSIFNINFNYNSFLRECVGQVLYNNPYIYVVTFVTIVSFFKNRPFIQRKIGWFFLIFSFPLVFTTLYLSLSRDTLPHWSGISYLTMLPMTALYLSKRRLIDVYLFRGFLTLAFISVLLSYVINEGWFLPINKFNQKERVGEKDPLMDMYGWKQASEKIAELIIDRKLERLPIISNKWFPASHIHYYIARPNNMEFYCMGNLNDIHKYYWVNKEFKGKLNNVLYITDSRNFKHPKNLYSTKYNNIKLVKTIPITRNGIIVKYVFCFNLNKSI